MGRPPLQLERGGGSRRLGTARRLDDPRPGLLALCAAGLVTPPATLATVKPASFLRCGPFTWIPGSPPHHGAGLFFLILLAVILSRPDFLGCFSSLSAVTLLVDLVSARGLKCHLYADGICTYPHIPDLLSETCIPHWLLSISARVSNRLTCPEPNF